VAFLAGFFPETGPFGKWRFVLRRPGGPDDDDDSGPFNPLVARATGRPSIDIENQAADEQYLEDFKYEI
jgi:hypothetical protein